MEGEVEGEGEGEGGEGGEQEGEGEGEENRDNQATGNEYKSDTIHRNSLKACPYNYVGE